MAVALRAKTPISSIISVDNAPVDAALKSDFGKYIQGMRKVADAFVQKQSEADAILAEFESNVAVRQFLLTNLSRGKDGIQRFRIPVKYLANALDNMADFPFKDPEEARWQGPALFVRGTKSHYVADETMPIIGRFFPRFEIADVDSGHWVISEKPQEFRNGMYTCVKEWRRHELIQVCNQPWSSFCKTKSRLYTL
jgi:pimeloyl-ACP methyl ester carboxylesterase